MFEGKYFVKENRESFGNIQECSIFSMETSK
jgi:hypothetical protein